MKISVDARDVKIKKVYPHFNNGFMVAYRFQFRGENEFVIKVQVDQSN